MPCFFLQYISIANKLMAENELFSILESFGAKNADHDITGRLIYMEGVFMNTLQGRYIQLLEGDEQAVYQLYEKIIIDDRHHHVLLIGTGYSPARNYLNWSMGFEVTDLQYANTFLYYFDLHELAQDNLSGGNSSRCLNTFYNINIELPQSISVYSLE